MCSFKQSACNVSRYETNMLACALVCVITAVVDIRLLQAILLIRGCRQVVVEGMVLLRNHTRSAEGQKVVLLCF